jgi:hypothetical protein
MFSICHEKIDLSVFVNSAGAVCGWKTSKFFIYHQEESMAGHVGVNGVY